jgi:hypothetical protein
MRVLLMSILTLALTAGAHAAKADEVVIDLGRQATDTPAKVPARPGDVVTIMLKNRIPDQRYLVTVERRVIDIPALQSPLAAPTGRTDGCQPLRVQAAQLSKPETDDETKVADLVEALERALERGDCKDPDALTAIGSAIAMTLGPAPGAYGLKGGEELDIVVTRTRSGKTKKWETIVSTGPRGKWLTTYGFATIPNRDRKFFAKSDGNAKFLITPEEKPDDLKLVPSAFFIWLPTARQLSNWSPGLSGGLGVKQDNPAVFLGASLTHNWNLSVVAGLAVAKQARLNGRYVPNQEISDGLSDDQLNDRVFRATWMAALTYRFGSNPFADSGGSGSPKPTPSPSTTPSPKPAADVPPR